MRLFVTGASGYLGGALVKALRPRHSLRLLVRTPETLDGFCKGPGIDIVEGDLRVKASWEEALKGCDGVVHLAALVKQKAPAEQFLAVNRDAFRDLLELCWKRRVETFLYTSSFIALGPSEACADQHLWRASAYARSKREALSVAREYQKKGFPLTSLIPTVLYGPGARTEGNHLTSLLEGVTRGQSPPLPDGGKWIWNFAFIEDVAGGYLLTLERQKKGEEYVLGGASASVEQFFKAAASLSGKTLRLRPVPRWALESYALLEELRSSFSRHPPRLTRGALAVYRHDWDFQDRKAREELGYRPVSLEEGLTRTLAWLKETQ